MNKDELHDERDMDRSELDCSENDESDPAESGEIVDIIDGAHLLDRVRALILRFVLLPSAEDYDAVTLWVSHTHAMEAWDSTPRLAFLSAEPGSGKSRGLEITALLVPLALEAANATTASIIRAMDDIMGTPCFFIDEIDTKYSPKAQGDEELRGLLNAGHRRGGAFLRCEMVENQWLPVKKNAYSAVAMAGIGNLPDTILTRSVVIRMRKRAPHEVVEPYRRRDHEHLGHFLRDELAAWASQIKKRAAKLRPSLPTEIVDRNADVWEPLIVMGDLAGGAWPQKARAAALKFVNAARSSGPLSRGGQLLADIYDCFDDHQQLTSAEIVGKLVAMEESPWKDMPGRKIDQFRLSQMLKEFEIKSATIRLPGNKTLKGYRREMFHDAWSRYLTAPGKP